MNRYEALDIIKRLQGNLYTVNSYLTSGECDEALNTAMLSILTVNSIMESAEREQDINIRIDQRTFHVTEINYTPIWKDGESE